MDRWVLGELAGCVREVTRALDDFDSSSAGRAITSFVDGLSNWYVRRSRRRFWHGEPEALATLHTCVETLSRLMAPFTPFTSDYLWTLLQGDVAADAPDSVHLTDWPAVDEAAIDAGLAERMALVRRVVELGRATRAASGVRTRQPLARAVVAARGFGDLEDGLLAEIAEELNVARVEPAGSDLVEVTVKPNFPVAGPRLGPKIKEVAAALSRGEFEELADGGVAVAGETLSPEEVQRTEKVILEDWVVAHDGNVSVAVDPALDDELILEGRALELIRALNEQRKQQDLALTDRIQLRLPPEHTDLVTAYEDWIAGEVLATSIEVDENLEAPSLTKVG
jgi:isoleucyl-tRNA synthetase